MDRTRLELWELVKRRAMIVLFEAVELKGLVWNELSGSWGRLLRKWVIRQGKRDERARGTLLEEGKFDPYF
ncbi:hypothetical protein Syun_010248 [Stephania yunnanensis]|uniref:Uncharacterized protein n=1 Tax=Stephania yunnanensis TaxID=152371 RepID=A0AAP0KHZ8_9MAGN